MVRLHFQQLYMSPIHSRSLQIQWVYIGDSGKTPFATSLVFTLFTRNGLGIFTMTHFPFLTTSYGSLRFWLYFAQVPISQSLWLAFWWLHPNTFHAFCKPFWPLQILQCFSGLLSIHFFQRCHQHSTTFTSFSGLISSHFFGCSRQDYEFRVISGLLSSHFFKCSRQHSMILASFSKSFSHYSKVGFGFLYYGLFDFFICHGYWLHFLFKLRN